MILYIVVCSGLKSRNATKETSHMLEYRAKVKERSLYTSRVISGIGKRIFASHAIEVAEIGLVPLDV